MLLRILLLMTLSCSQAMAISLDSFINSTRPFPKVKKINEARTTERRKLECSAHNLRQTIEHKGFSHVQRLFDSCDKKLLRRNKISLFAQVGLTTWAFEKKERFREIVFNLDDGDVLKGILAIKDAPQALPLVVIRAGIYGRADFSFTNSTTMLSYFEHAPFHVLLLENASNEDYVSRNGRLRLGGLSGGQQILEAISQIKSSNFGPKFSELHLVGFSLGAHDSLYANIFSNHHPSVKFRSVTALCPALDLEPSIKNVFDQPIIGVANSSYLLHFMERQWQALIALQRVITFPLNGKDLSRDAVRDALVNGAAAQLAIDRTKLPAPLSQRVETTDEFLKLSRFPYYSGHIKTPTYIIQALDDSVTPHKVNLGKYQSKLSRNKNINTLSLLQGEHCAYHAKYGLDLISNLITGIVKKHSRLSNPSVLVSAPRELQQASTSFFSMRNWPTSSHYQLADYEMTDLVYSGGRLMAEMRFSFFDPRGSSDSDPSGKMKCSNFHYWNAPLDCKHQLKTQFPASIVGINDKPGTQAAFSAISRFNVTAALLDDSKREILGSTKPPRYFFLPKLQLKDGYY